MTYKSITITNANDVYEQAPKVSHFYVGFSSVDISNTTSKLFDLDLIKQDILNQFNTRKGERVMNPEYGTVIWDLLMEPLTPVLQDVLSQDIEKICNSDPRVKPTQINVEEYTSGYLVEISLNLVDTDQIVNMYLSFDQKLGLLVQ